MDRIRQHVLWTRGDVGLGRCGFLDLAHFMKKLVL